MAERTAFVTGGTGFLGLNLVEQLVAQAWQVTALHRPSSDTRLLRQFPVRLVEGDILDPGSLRRAMPAGVDAVFHVAADISMWSGHADRQTRINVDGTRHVVAAALDAGAGRLVHTSTWNTYGLGQGEISEELPQRGGETGANYDRSKLLAEQEVRAGVARGLDAVIINPSHIMGRYDRKGWPRLIIMAHTRWLPGVPPGAGTFCHAEAVARAHIAAAERGRRGANYLMSGADASFEGPMCAACGRAALRLYLCDDRLHTLCDACGHGGRLDAARCPACQPATPLSPRLSVDDPTEPVRRRLTGA